MRRHFLTLVTLTVAANCTDSSDSQTLAVTTERVTLDASRQDPRCREPVGFLQNRPFDFHGGGAIANAEMAGQIGALHFQANYGQFGWPEHPIRATVRNGVWHIEQVLPDGSIGGGLHIEMCQSNGKVLRIWGEQ